MVLRSEWCQLQDVPQVTNHLPLVVELRLATLDTESRIVLLQLRHVHATIARQYVEFIHECRQVILLVTVAPGREGRRPQAG
jgi:hypothetical protein